MWAAGFSVAQSCRSRGRPCLHYSLLRVTMSGVSHSLETELESSRNQSQGIDNTSRKWNCPEEQGIWELRLERDTRVWLDLMPTQECGTYPLTFLLTLNRHGDLMEGPCKMETPGPIFQRFGVLIGHKQPRVILLQGV